MSIQHAILAAMTWVKRNPLKAGLLVLALVLIGTLSWFIGWVAGLFGAKFYDGFMKLWESKLVRIGLFVLLFFTAPMAALGIVTWLIIDWILPDRVSLLSKGQAKTNLELST